MYMFHAVSILSSYSTRSCPVGSGYKYKCRKISDTKFITHINVNNKSTTYHFPVVNGDQLFPWFQNIQGISLPWHQSAIIDHVFETFAKQVRLSTPIRMQAVKNLDTFRILTLMKSKQAGNYKH